MTSLDARAWLRKARPSFYVVLVLAVLAVALAYKLRARGVFACPAQYGAAYLSNCNSPNFGDYDHGALWFGLEPDVVQAVARARVLFLGNSRMQFALSGAKTPQWFREAGLSYYMLGFSHSETVMFTRPLLERIEPRAQVVVINVDRFFDDRLSPPAEQILNEKDVRSRYREKQVWQSLHRSACGVMPLLCGSTLAVFRERGTGLWRTSGVLPDDKRATSDGKPGNTERWPAYVALAKKFVDDLGVAPQCVLLTLVPTVDTKRAEAHAIADALGKPLIEPVVDGLSTFDGSHLDPASAQRWAAAFFESAGPRIRECGADRSALANDRRRSAGGGA